MSILHKFYQISDLKINFEKTLAIKFRVIGHSRMTLSDDMDCIWMQEFTSLGINCNILKLNQITFLI